MKVNFEVNQDNNFDNWYVTFPNGDKVQVRMAFPNRKYIYKVRCMFNENKKDK